MRLHLLRLHSADQYDFSAMASWGISIKLSEWYQHISFRDPLGTRPQVIRDLCVSGQLGGWAPLPKDLLRAKHPVKRGVKKSVKTSSCFNHQNGNSLSHESSLIWNLQVGGFKLFQCCITNPAESILISTKNSKDHKLSAWHYVITSKILMTKKHVSLKNCQIN